MSVQPLVSAAELQKLHAVVRCQSHRERSADSVPTYKCLRAEVQSISVEGIALLVRSGIEPGTDVVIQLSVRAQESSLGLQARVTYAKVHSEGRWIIDCQFMTKPTDKETRNLLSEHTAVAIVCQGK